MKKFFILMIVIAAPWVILFKNDDPIGGMIAMVMQALIIGWLPASIWAWRIAYSSSPKNKNSEQKSNIKAPDPK